eukprot:scaffold196856_cov23-Prasinocladus_malaysianus.AAC.1
MIMGIYPNRTLTGLISLPASCCSLWEENVKREKKNCKGKDWNQTEKGAVKSAGEQPDLQRLMDAAERAAETSQLLAARQAENLEKVATELFCSPEILRQVWMLFRILRIPIASALHDRKGAMIIVL